MFILFLYNIQKKKIINQILDYLITKSLNLKIAFMNDS